VNNPSSIPVMEKSIIKNVRAFNRFYTNIIGLLDKSYLETGYTLTEARILFEISPVEKTDTSKIIDSILIDKGYLSRTLKKLEKDQLITKSKSEEDSRASKISLTARGIAELDMLNTLTNLQIEVLLQDLTSKDRDHLVLHMNSIIRILGK
jgi:DNA-binding MarR family transcriptional regulator